MIDQLISALKISLAECKKFEEPAEYVYELNQVLNRYKTNLFKLMPDKDNVLHDPKEFFQMKIRATWRTSSGIGTDSRVLDSSPVMLHVNGFIPLIGERLNKEMSYNKAVPIDDIIDLERLRRVKDDYYRGPNQGSKLYKSEDDIMNDKYGWKTCNLSMYTQFDKVVDGVINFNFQLSGMVYNYVVYDYERAAAERMVGTDSIKPPRKKRKVEPVEPKVIPKSIITPTQDTVNDNTHVVVNGVKMSKRFAKRLNMIEETSKKIAQTKGHTGLTANRRKLW